MTLPFNPSLPKGAPVGLTSQTRGFIQGAKNQIAANDGFMSGIKTNVTITGLDVLYMDMYGIADFWGEVMWPLMDISGTIIQHNAQDIVQVDTQDTRRSIHYNIFTTPGGMGVEVGPTTEYAPHLEFGTFRSRPYPFMIPALDMMENALGSAVEQIAEVAGNRRHISQSEYGDLNHTLSKYRGVLYSNSRRLGNISAILSIPILPSLRSRMQNQAIQIGNIQAVMQGHVAQRYTHILTGRLRGQVQGGVTGGQGISGSLGPQAGRVYNVFVGRIGRSFLP